MTGRAIVCHGPVRDGKWKIENVRLRPINENELVVKIVASGICHTDLVVADAEEGFGVFYPSIKGHEGEGRTLSVVLDGGRHKLTKSQVPATSNR